MRIDPKIFKVQAALRACLPKGGKILAAVSGGADSMALLHGVSVLKGEGWCDAIIAHVEHGLRGEESWRDAALVQEYCAKLQLPYICRSVDAAALVAAGKLSVEDAARRLRYGALYTELERVKADFIVTAHHKGDQAETVLFKLLRGSGAAGLSGMKVMQGKILRPFLHFEPEVLKEYCALSGMEYCFDSSNNDLHYTRNRIRKLLVPFLERHFNPSVQNALVQTAELLREDNECLNALCDAVYDKRVRAEKDKVVLNAAGWRSLAPAVRKRVLRKCCFASGCEEISYVQTNELDKVCLERVSGKKVPLTGGIWCSYAYDELFFSKKLLPHDDCKTQKFNCAVAWNGEKLLTVAVPKGSVTVQCFTERPQSVQNRIIYPLSLLERSDGSINLVLRFRENGDRLKIYGGAGSKKIKDIFIDRKIPRQERDAKLLLCCGDIVMGVFGVANGAWEKGVYNRWLTADFIPEDKKDE